MGLFITACGSIEPDFNLNWKEFTFKEAGFKAEFPCEPIKDFNSFQDEPRPVHTYEFSCDIEGMKFYISSKHYLDNFNENSIKDIFDSFESGHKKFLSIGLKETKAMEIKKFSNTKGKLYKFENQEKAIIYQLVLANDERFYDLTNLLLAKNNSTKESKSEFDKISKRFRDSFEIIKND